MEQEFRALLLGLPAITGICGNRIYFGEALQGSDLPAIILHNVSDVGDHTLAGPGNISTATIQVDCYGLTYGAAKTLARAVRASIDGHSGGNLSAVFHENSRDGREGGTNEAERPWRVSADYSVVYEIS